MTLALPLACLAAFTAGLIDAIVGGGGLIQLPALLILFPETPVATLLGTNKLAAASGTALATTRYLQRVAVDWRGVAPAALIAFIGSLTGAYIATLTPSTLMRPVALVLLIAVALYTFLKKDLGINGNPKARIPLWLAILLGSILGLYDGFFGPGTGSFLVFAFVGIVGMDFLSASAAAKLVNLSTNLAALGIFIATDHVSYTLALFMAICNMTGAWLGTRIALQHGASLVRRIFIGVVISFVLKLAWDISF